MTNTANDLIGTELGPVLISATTRHGLKSWTVETLDFTVQINQRRFESRASYMKTTRVYGALEAFNGAEWGTRETALVLDAVDRENSGELTGRCPALAAHQRHGVRVARLGIETQLPAILAMLRAQASTSNTEGLDAKFSKKAGCSMCPCSPGFVLDRTLYVDDRPVDMWFSV